MSDAGRILLADDEESFLRSTAELFRQEGYECACAPDAATAIALLNDGEFDLLISDINMPGNSSLELIHEIDEIAEGLPVILVTGYPSVSSATDSISLPVEAYLVKPVEFDELLRQAQASIEKTHLFRAFTRMSGRLADWHKDMKVIEASLDGAPDRDESRKAFCELSFLNIVSTLSDLTRLAMPADEEDDRPPPNAFQGERQAMLENILEETIAVLEKTKTSFKSRELGDLRRKLETYMRRVRR